MYSIGTIRPVRKGFKTQFFEEKEKVCNIVCFRARKRTVTAIRPLINLQIRKVIGVWKECYK